MGVAVRIDSDSVTTTTLGTGSSITSMIVSSTGTTTCLGAFLGAFGFRSTTARTPDLGLCLFRRHALCGLLARRLDACLAAFRAFLARRDTLLCIAKEAFEFYPDAKPPYPVAYAVAVGFPTAAKTDRTAPLGNRLAMQCVHAVAEGVGAPESAALPGVGGGGWLSAAPQPQSAAPAGAPAAAGARSPQGRPRRPRFLAARPPVRTALSVFLTQAGNAVKAGVLVAS
jgi:hypothetical protein